MPVGLADLVDVRRAHALLHAGRARVRRLRLAQEVGLELAPCPRSRTAGRVVQRSATRWARPYGRGLLEMVTESLDDLVGLHDSSFGCPGHAERQRSTGGRGARSDARRGDGEAQLHARGEAQPSALRARAPGVAPTRGEPAGMRSPRAGLAVVGAGWSRRAPPRRPSPTPRSRSAMPALHLGTERADRAGQLAMASPRLPAKPGGRGLLGGLPRLAGDAPPRRSRRSRARTAASLLPTSASAADLPEWRPGFADLALRRARTALPMP